MSRTRSTAPLALVFATLVAAFALASPAAAKTLVRYEKSGGFAGIQRSLTVGDGGGATLSRSRSGAARHFKLTRAHVHDLRKALRDARFSTLRALYAPKVQIADGFTQVVRYAGRQVTVRDGARPPARLAKLLQRLSQLGR